jgi:protein-S-isoprenylcysteine O-methyltransferase Ste14
MIMSPDRSDSVPASSGVRVFPPAIYLGGLLIGFVVQFLWPVSLATNGGVSLVRIAGGGLLLIGVIFIAAAAMAFRHAGTSPNPTRPTTALTNVGPYRYSRSPMYVGLAVIQAGVALLANAVWPLGGTVFGSQVRRGLSLIQIDSAPLAMRSCGPGPDRRYKVLLLDHLRPAVARRVSGAG